MAVSRFQSFELKARAESGTIAVDWWSAFFREWNVCGVGAAKCESKVSGKTNYPTLAKGRPGWGTLKDIDE